jgi:outer membrane protein TolC
MKSGVIGIIIFLVTGVLFNSTFAQDSRKLTLEESIQIGLKNSELIHSSQMKVNYAKARLSEVNTYRLPSLKLNASYTRLSEIDPFVLNTPFGNFNISPSIVNNYNIKLSLQQPIFTGFKLASSSNIAEYNYEAQKQVYTKDEQKLILDIKTAYWNLFKVIKVKSVVDENIDLIKAHLSDVKNFYENGISTKNDVLKVQVQLADAQLRQIDADNGVKLAKNNLNNIIGLPLSTNIEIQLDVSTVDDSVPQLDKLIDEAKENRPELKEMDFRLKAGESGVTLAESNWYPQVYLAGNYNYARPNQRIFPLEDKFNGTWDVSVGLSWDIWNWLSTSDQTEQAEAQLEQVKDGYKSLKDGITLEVTQNYLNVLKAKERILASSQSVHQAEENYRVTNETFKNGLALNSDLLDAEFALLQAKTNYIQSLADYELAKASLEKSIGK